MKDAQVDNMKPTPHHQTSCLVPLPQRSGWVDELYSEIMVDRLEHSVRIGGRETDLRDDIKRHLSKLLVKVPSRTLQQVLDPITSRAWIAEFQNETSLQVLQLGKSYQDTDVLKRDRTGMDIACVGSWHWEKVLRAIGFFLQVKWIEIEDLAGTAMDVRGRADEVEILGTIQTHLQTALGRTLWYGAAICEMSGNRTVMGGLIVDTSFVRMIFSGSDQTVIVETPVPTSSESGNSTSSEFGFSQLLADFRHGKSFPHSIATRTGATALLDLAVTGIKLTEAGRPDLESAEVGGGTEREEEPWTETSPLHPRESSPSPENILLAGLPSARVSMPVRGHLALDASDIIERWTRDLPEKFEVDHRDLSNLTNVPLEAKPEWRVRRVSVSTFNRLL
jgi:hypothetical protein